MVKFVRGDTCLFKVQLSSTGDESLNMSDIDTIFITCRKTPDKDSDVLFQKNKDDIELDENAYLHFKFEPEDTENLYYGLYYFDVEITLKSGYRKSKLYQFELTEETTIHGGVYGD